MLAGVPLPMADQDLSSSLDSEISSIRAEICELTDRRHVLTSSLMSTNAVQDVLQQHTLEPDVAPVILNSGKHAQTNHHRVVFSTTSFPFKDPSPHTDSPNLLGVRIDICVRGGTFVKPYYLLLKRGGKDMRSLRVHRHTIPVFIPLAQLELKYLTPLSQESEDESNLKPWKRGKQDLRRFTRELRRELIAWHMRMGAVDWLRENLSIETHHANGDATSTEEDQPPRNTLGIVSVAATAIEARYIRLEWNDGRVGRIKLSNRGVIEDAVVMRGELRDKSTENLLTGGDRRLEGVIERLSTSNG